MNIYDIYKIPFGVKRRQYIIRYLVYNRIYVNRRHQIFNLKLDMDLKYLLKKGVIRIRRENKYGNYTVRHSYLELIRK